MTATLALVELNFPPNIIGLSLRLSRKQSNNVEAIISSISKGEFRNSCASRTEYIPRL